MKMRFDTKNLNYCVIIKKDKHQMLEDDKME